MSSQPIRADESKPQDTYPVHSGGRPSCNSWAASAQSAPLPVSLEQGWPYSQLSRTGGGASWRAPGLKFPFPVTKITERPSAAESNVTCRKTLRIPLKRRVTATSGEPLYPVRTESIRRGKNQHFARFATEEADARLERERSPR